MAMASNTNKSSNYLATTALWLWQIVDHFSPCPNPAIPPNDVAVIAPMVEDHLFSPAVKRILDEISVSSSLEQPTSLSAGPVKRSFFKLDKTVSSSATPLEKNGEGDTFAQVMNAATVQTTEDAVGIQPIVVCHNEAAAALDPTTNNSVTDDMQKAGDLALESPIKMVKLEERGC